MNEDEERLVRVTIGFLAAHTRQLATHVGAINVVLMASLEPGDTLDMLKEVQKSVLDVETSLIRIMDAFPPEIPGGRNGR